MLNNPEKFIQANSPDGGFLQSEEWRSFQEAVGRKTYNISSDGFWANIVEHTLPAVGKYFYVPRGPIFLKNNNLDQLLDLAKKEKASWIRVDVENEEKLEILKNEFPGHIEKAPHNVQPKEVFIIDITKTDEEILLEMKSKTRYNIRLAEKKDVKVFASREEKYVNEFLRLVNVTAKRDGITAHPESYYRKMIEVISSNILKLYVAEYEGKIIAANLVLFYGNTCTYMHGASDDEVRNVMAPYLLQWTQIKDAKKMGCTRYDFGGVKIIKSEKLPASPAGRKVKSYNKSWAGITRFKTGFSPNMMVTRFIGSYDIIINLKVYWLYRSIQKIKSFMK